MSTPIDAFPLSWPLGRPRTPVAKRERAKFGSKIAGTTDRPWSTSRRLTIDAATSRLRRQIDLLGASGLVISTNLALRRDGLPRSGQAEPKDPGVAVYFRLDGRAYTVACDKWDKIADNIAAIAAHLDAMRGQDRWGCGSLEQAFAGYKALTAAEAVKSWWTVLGFDKPPEQWSIVEAKHRELTRLHHPDRGGDAGTMAEINAARDQARAYYGEVQL